MKEQDDKCLKFISDAEKDLMDMIKELDSLYNIKNDELLTLIGKYSNKIISIERQYYQSIISCNQKLKKYIKSVELA